MNNETWEPVEEGVAYEYTEPGEYIVGYGEIHEHYGVSVHGQQLRIFEGATDDYTAIDLPADLRLCRRVDQPDEAISEDALRAEGWEIISDGYLEFAHTQTMPRVSVSFCSFWPDEVFVRIGGYNTGIDTLSKLRALVTMLGGGE